MDTKQTHKHTTRSKKEKECFSLSHTHTHMIHLELSRIYSLGRNLYYQNVGYISQQRAWFDENISNNKEPQL